MSETDSPPPERTPAPREPGLPEVAGELPAAERPRSCMGSLWAMLGVAVGAVYILNPSFGVFELLPDNAPGIGNLDEAGATALVIFGLRYLLRRRP